MPRRERRPIPAPLRQFARKLRCSEHDARSARTRSRRHQRSIAQWIHNRMLCALLIRKRQSNDALASPSAALARRWRMHLACEVELARAVNCTIARDAQVNLDATRGASLAPRWLYLLSPDASKGCGLIPFAVRTPARTSTDLMNASSGSSRSRSSLQAATEGSAAFMR